LTDAEKFARDANVANVLFQKGEIDQATHQKMIAMYRERYKVIDEVAAREAQQQAHQRARLDEYAAHKQAMAKREEDSALFMMNLRKQMEVAESEAAKKKAEQIATARKAEEDAVIFLMNLRKQGQLMEEEAAKKKAEQIASARKSEEDGIVFLMNIRKQMQLAEEEAAKKKAEQIAAAKKAEEESIIFMMNLRKQIQLAEEEAAKKKAEQIAAAKKAEEDAMMFMHRLKQTIDADNKARQQETLNKILAQQQQEIQGILRIEQSRQQASKLLLDSINNERQATQQAAEAEKNARWDTINFLIKSEADLAEQKRKRNQEELAAQEKLKQNAIDLMKSQASLGIVPSGRPSQIPATDLSKPLIDPVTGQQIDAKKEILSLEEAIAKLEQRRHEHAMRMMKIRLEAVRQEQAERAKLEASFASAQNKMFADQKRQQFVDRFGERKVARGEFAASVGYFDPNATTEQRRKAIAAIKAYDAALERSRIAELKANSAAMEASVASQKREQDYNRIRGMVDQAKTAQQRYSEAVKFVKDQEKLGAITKQESIAIQRNLNAELQKQGSMNKIASNLGLGSFRQLAATVGVFSAATVAYNALRSSLSITIEYQRAEAAMAALTGSIDEARGKMAEFRALDRKTPLSFMDFARGAKTLMGFGLEADRTTKVMESLSAISMGNSERFQSLALAFGQVRASGKLAGQEILQMVNAGFNPLQEISRLTGEDMGSLKKKVEEGRVSFEEVAVAIELATMQGGRFAEMNKNLQNTLGGQIDKLKSDFAMIGLTVGESLVPVLEQTVGLLQAMGVVAQDTEDEFTFIQTWANGMAFTLASLRDAFTLDVGFSNVNKMLDDTERREQERLARVEAIAKKRQEQAKKEAEEQRLIAQYGEEGYKQMRLEQARVEGDRARLIKEEEAALVSKHETMAQVQKELEDFGKTERQLFIEKIGLGEAFLSIQEQDRRQRALDVYDQLQQMKNNEKLLEQETKMANIGNIRQMLRDKKISQKAFDESMGSVREDAQKLTEKFNPMITARREIEHIKNLLAGGLIDKDTADKASMEIARGIDKAVGKTEAPTRVKSLADAMMISMENRRKTQHEKDVERLLRDIERSINQGNRGPTVGNVRP
jgi:tape measure domain-containing protein